MLSQKEQYETSTDAELSDMFRNIGRAKESCARGINEQIDKERAEKQAAITGLFSNGEEFGDDEDIDALFEKLDKELRELQNNPKTSREDLPKKKGLLSFLLKKKTEAKIENSYNGVQQDENIGNEQVKNDASGNTSNIISSAKEDDIPLHGIPSEVFAECYTVIAADKDSKCFGYGIGIFSSFGSQTNFFKSSPEWNKEKALENCFIKLLKELLSVNNLKSVVVYCDEISYPAFLSYSNQELFDKVTKKIKENADFKVVYNLFSTNISRRETMLNLTKTIIENEM